MPTHDIIGALIDIEQKAAAAADSIRREQDKLPARIEAETLFVCQNISRETESELLKLNEESKKAVEAHISAIWEENAKQLIDLEFDFAKQREDLRRQLFERLTCRKYQI